MKTKRNLRLSVFAIIAMACMTFVLSSCRKDDADADNYSILGSWRCTSDDSRYLFCEGGVGDYYTAAGDCHSFDYTITLTRYDRGVIHFKMAYYNNGYVTRDNFNGNYVISNDTLRLSVRSVYPKFYVRKSKK